VKAKRVAYRALTQAGLIEHALGARDQARVITTRTREQAARWTYRQTLRPGDRPDPSVVLGYYDGGWEVARSVQRLVVREVMDANLALVADLLDGLGIAYVLMPFPASPNRWRVAVSTFDKAAVLARIDRLDDPAAYVYVDDSRLRPGARRIHLAGGVTMIHRHWLNRARVWRLYVNQADPAARTVLGHLHGCELEFWAPPVIAPDPLAEGDGADVSESATAESADTGAEAEAEADAGVGSGAEPAPGEAGPVEPDAAETSVLSSARWNRYATELPRGIAPTGTVPVGGREYSTMGEFVAAPHLQDVTFPVDLVYTWVDGRDSAWLDRKDEVLRGLDLELTVRDAYDDSRYRNRDELKYSLRSVEMYADFVRHVYIVTDDQVPAWLDTDNPRVSIVSHKELFGDLGQLPTFNSHAIEATLHRIEGLAEHYVYLNDDFLFTRRVRPNTFFASNGLSYFYPSRALITAPGISVEGRSVDNAARKSQATVLAGFDRLLTQKIRHAPYAQRRSVLFEAERILPEEFAQTRASQIRGPADLPVASSFSHYFGFLQGTAVPGSIRSRYVELGSPQFLRNLENLARTRSADTLCINDSGTELVPDLDVREQALRDFLDVCWPLPSEFEKPPGREG
jgi:hypothetical protein